MNTNPANDSEALNNESPLLIVDMGSQSRKNVKRLRKGKGKLMDRVSEAIAELRANGAADGVGTFVVVVKEKAENPLRKMLG